MSRLADYGKFDNLDDGSDDEDVKPQRKDAPPPPGTEPGLARYYKRVQVGCVLVRDYGAGAGTPADRILALTLLRRYGPRIKGKRVVELGAQAGAAGLTAAKMGAAWTSLVSDDPRAAYALRVESVKNGVSRTVKNVCTDWLEDDLNLDVAADPTDLLVAANALHSPRECGRLAAALNCVGIFVDFNAIEQTQLRRQHRVEGVGRLKFDVHIGAQRLRQNVAAPRRRRRVAALRLGRRGQGPPDHGGAGLDVRGGGNSSRRRGADAAGARARRLRVHAADDLHAEAAARGRRPPTARRDDCDELNLIYASVDEFSRETAPAKRSPRRAAPSGAPPRPWRRSSRGRRSGPRGS